MGGVITFFTFTLLPAVFVLGWGDQVVADVLWWRARRTMRGWEQAERP